MPDQTLTTAAAAEAQNALDAAAFEDALCIAGDYINARRRDYRQGHLTGTEIGQLLGAVALAVRAYQQHADPVAARWDRIVTRDEDGTVWVLCTTDPGHPVALALDEEHAEALAGSLLDTPDGEEVDPDPAPAPSYRDGVRDALAAAAHEVEHADGTTSPAVLASAVRMMGTAGVLAQDGPVKVEAPTDSADLQVEIPGLCDRVCGEMTYRLNTVASASRNRACHGEDSPREFIVQEISRGTSHIMAIVAPALARRDGIIRALDKKLLRAYDADDAEAVRRNGHIRELNEQLAAVRSVIATWEYRTHHGDSGPMDLLADLQAALRDRPDAPAAQDPAATWPSRAARQLADDAHP